MKACSQQPRTSNMKSLNVNINIPVIYIKEEDKEGVRAFAQGLLDPGLTDPGFINLGNALTVADNGEL